MHVCLPLPYIDSIFYIMTLSLQHPHRERNHQGVQYSLLYVQVNRDNHILCYDCIFTCTCCLDIITYMHIRTTCVLHVLQLSLSLSPPSLPPFCFSRSRLSPSIVDPSFVTLRSRYLWELKVSCKRHWMSGHPGIVCVCVCVCVCV